MKKIIFNSVGSNYTLAFALRSLLGFGGSSDVSLLRDRLAHAYAGEALLFYKGRQAIEYALKHANLPQGSHVIISSYTCVVLPVAVTNAGHVPLYADISTTNLNFSVTELERIYTENVKAVIIQNTFGFAADITPIETFCKKHNIVLIEDLAHNVGGVYADGRKTGTVGDYVVLSFSQDKLLDVVSGGALIIRTKKESSFVGYWSNSLWFQQVCDRFYPILSYTIRTLYSFFGIGKLLHTVLRAVHVLPKPVMSLDHTPFQTLPSWCASLVLDRVDMLPRDVERRRNLARKYLAALPEMMHPMVTIESINHASCLRIPLVVPKRDELIAFLRKQEIHLSDIWYDVPVSPKRFWHLFEKTHTGPVAIEAAKTMFNLPTHATLRDEDAERIIEAIKKWQSHSEK